MRAYKNQYGWSIKCKGKDKDGQEISCYMPIYFNKCEPEGEQVDFIPVDFFPSAYQSKNGIMPKLVVNSWQRVVVEEKKSPVKDEDLPF